jgi:O-antigen ligase
LLFVGAIFGEPPKLREVKPAAFLLLAAVLLVLLQLIPLPPGIWQAMPGREMLANAAVASGQAQPWRPLSIVPSAAANAASSLVVAAAVLIFTAGLKGRERKWLPGLVLGLVAASMFIGLLQLSGIRVDNPAYDTPAQISGTFSNRNHFALFLALGCLLAPAWAVSDARMSRWRGPLAIGLILLLLLTTLGSGSRAGSALGLIGLVIGMIVARQGLGRASKRQPRWVFPALIAGFSAVVLGLVAVSVVADRAVAISRISEGEVNQDLRSRALPTILQMMHSYSPAGTGFGGFDPIFRMHEPFAMLKPTYFNHAHNDLIEIALDGGAPGLLLLIAGVLWWGWASVLAWRGGSTELRAESRLGSAMLLLVIIASAFDYPARTPMIQAVVVLAGIWLGSPTDERSGPAVHKSG